MPEDGTQHINALIFVIRLAWLSPIAPFQSLTGIYERD